jgi:hypothetical protein
MTAERKLLASFRYEDAIGAEALVHVLFYGDAGRIAEAASNSPFPAPSPAPVDPSVENPT